MLAGLGFNLHERTSLKLGPVVVKTLATLQTGGYVTVFTKGATDDDVAKANGTVTKAPNLIAVVDARVADFAAVRPHVNTALKTATKKAAHGFAISAPRKDDEGESIAFVVRKTTK